MAIITDQQTVRQLQMAADLYRSLNGSLERAVAGRRIPQEQEFFFRELIRAGLATADALQNILQLNRR